jgi:hypothetical protein
MSVVRKTAMVAMAAAVCMIAVSTAQATKKDSGVVDASKRVAGFTAGDLLGEELRQLLELPLDVNPLAGSRENNCLSAGHKDKVLMLWTSPAPPSVCNIKPGTPVFFFSLFAECSSVELPPFFGATEEEQRQCALDDLATLFDFDAILVSIDGGPPVNIGLDRFLAVSGQGTVELPDPNILFVDAEEATFVGAAYSAMVRPLPPGAHTIAVTIVGGPSAGTTQSVVNVVPGLKSRGGPAGRGPGRAVRAPPVGCPRQDAAQHCSRPPCLPSWPSETLGRSTPTPAGCGESSIPSTAATGSTSGYRR